jgi:hypothetical protein
MYCQNCGVEAPTQYVALHQNIGLLVMRFYNGVEGNLCKPCIDSHFWTYTAITGTLGWWGIISLLITPFFLVNNVYYYLNSLGLESPRPGAVPPHLTDDDAARLAPHVDAIIGRINAGEPLDQVCQHVGQQAGVSPGKVYLFLQALAAHAEQQ